MSNFSIKQRLFIRRNFKKIFQLLKSGKFTPKPKKYLGLPRPPKKGSFSALSGGLK